MDKPLYYLVLVLYVCVTLRDKFQISYDIDCSKVVSCVKNLTP